MDDPESFYDPREPDVVLVVGTAKLAGSARMAKMRAEADARTKLLAAKGTGESKMTATRDEDGATVKTAVSGTTTAKNIAEWTAPNGTIYVLMR